MSDKEKNTERIILEAAKKVFLQKGHSGARMQEIADEAGINKALLHYYFRSKDKLFEAIFQDAFQNFIPQISGLINSELPVIEKIWAFVDSYIDLLLKNPHVPIFILSELHHNPDRLTQMFMNYGIQPSPFLSQLDAEINAGRIRPVNPRHLIVNMISMCVMPFAAGPILRGVLFGNDEDEYQKFLLERKTEVTLIIMNAIKVQ